MKNYLKNGRLLKLDMKSPNDMYTVESVLKGHPDKICDQISDGLLDLYLEADKNARTAIECLGTNQTLVVAGEVSSTQIISVEKSCQELYKRITNLASINVKNLLTQQSSQLGKPINNGGAGDQGIMYGYACNSNYNSLPYGYWLVNMLAKRLDEYREKSNLFLPDGKIQATILDNNIKQLTINVQHHADSDLEALRTQIQKETLYDIESENIIINEDTEFINGGFINDTGLTGRKIIIDTYGGLAPHGGGAFSGKDPSKVDRSAAYMCRFVAKNIVANGFAKECTVSVAYDFGKENPAMIYAIADGVYSPSIMGLIKTYFDFRPQAIIERLNLRATKYLPTSLYGHFTDASYPWEQVAKM